MIKEEEELFWKYNIPEIAKFKVKYTESCNVCNAPLEFVEWLSKFLVTNIPIDALQNVVRKKFNIIIDSESLLCHRMHILVEYQTNEEIRTQATEDFKKIESDLPKITDEKKAMETAIRMLYAKILDMEHRGDTGKEFLMAIRELKGLIEMKLKLTNELPADDVRLNLSDIIKIGGKPMKKIDDDDDDDDDFKDEDSKGEAIILPEIKEKC